MQPIIGLCPFRKAPLNTQPIIEIPTAPPAYGNPLFAAYCPARSCISTDDRKTIQACPCPVCCNLRLVHQANEGLRFAADDLASRVVRLDSHQRRFAQTLYNERAGRAITATARLAHLCSWAYSMASLNVGYEDARELAWSLKAALVDGDPCGGKRAARDVAATLEGIEGDGQVDIVTMMEVIDGDNQAGAATALDVAHRGIWPRSKDPISCLEDAVSAARGLKILEALGRERIAAELVIERWTDSEGEGEDAIRVQAHRELNWLYGLQCRVEKGEEEDVDEEMKDAIDQATDALDKVLIGWFH